MKRIKVLLVIFVLLCVSFDNVYADIDEGYLEYIQNSNDSPELPKINSKNYLLYNLDDKTVLYEKNVDKKIQIASLTKIMTVLTAIENIDDLDDTVTITRGAFADISEYTTAGFKVGDEVTYWDLLYGTMLPSGADAGQATAISVSGDIDSFVKLMNDEAKKIGMDNSHFSNPIGRDDDDNYSTVNDIVKLLLYALDNKDFYKIYTTKEYETTNGIELLSTLKQSGDKYKLDTDKILGSKSGYTDGAGLCLTSIAKYNDINYLLVTSDAPYASRYPYHIKDAINIYDYYNDNYEYRKIIKKKQKLETIDIVDGFEKKYDIVSSDDISLYLDKDMDMDKIEYIYEGIDKLNYKIKKDTKLGKVKVSYNDNILYTYPVILTEKIKYKHTKLVISILGVIILLLIYKMFRRKKRRRRKKHGKRKIKR